MTIKATWLFGQSTNKSGSANALVQVGGWSESWYSTMDINAAQGAFENLAQYRAALLSNSAAIIGQRYSIIGGGSSTSGRQFPGRAGVLSDIPQMALLCTCLASGQPNIRRFMLRGIPDDIVYEGSYKPTGAFTTALNTYFTKVTSGSWCMRGRDLTVANTALVGVVIGTGARGLVQTATSLTLLVGQQVQFMRTRDQYGRTIKGTFTVAEVTDGFNFAVSNWTYGNVDRGFVRRVGAPIFPVALDGSFTPVRITTRRVGRPFGQYRGRQSKRR
jgi:hypothetical protein